jgi:hypothetical protein
MSGGPLEAVSITTLREHVNYAWNRDGNGFPRPNTREDLYRLNSQLISGTIKTSFRTSRHWHVPAALGR